MVNQTYLPNKTVTLNEGNLNFQNTPASVPKNTVGAKENYSSHKTVNLSNAPVNEKKEEKPKEAAPLTNSNPPPAVTRNDVKVNNNYLSHKSVNLTEETAPPEKQEKQAEVQQSSINKPTIHTPKNDSKSNYSSHKTVDLTGGTTVVKNVEKPAEDNVQAINKPVLRSVDVGTQDNYLSHKTVNLTDEKSFSGPENKSSESTVYIDIKTTTISEEKIAVQNVTTKSEESQQIETHSEYSERKTVSITGAEVSSTDFNKDKQQEINRPQVTGEKRDHKEIYSSLKTVSISTNEEIPVVTESERKVVERPIVSSGNTSEPATTHKLSGTDEGIYPYNKSFSFVKDDGKPPGINNVGATVKNEGNGSREKINPQIVTAAPVGKAKKPVLWMILSSALFIASATAAWFSYNQHQEIFLLKQNEVVLTDSLNKLQRHRLHFDDLIIKGGKVDAKNNITVVDNVSEAEALRICFSINGNSYASRGKKILFIRFIDPNKNALVKATENTFEYKGGQIPFSLKETVDYKNEEMMLCFDYKVEATLAKGIYKAEIYTDGILDGIETFELK